MIIAAEKLAAFEVRLPGESSFNLTTCQYNTNIFLLHAINIFGVYTTALATTSTGHEDECMIKSARGLVLTRPGSKLCVALVIKC